MRWMCIVSDRLPIDKVTKELTTAWRGTTKTRTNPDHSTANVDFVSQRFYFQVVIFRQGVPELRPLIEASVAQPCIRPGLVGGDEKIMPGRIQFLHEQQADLRN